MPREKEYDSNADRQKAYRERKKQEREEERAEAQQLAHLEATVTEEETRRRFGYSSSETRTKAERDAAAERMLAAHAPNPDIVVPADIREVWGEDPFPALAIERWGLEGFRRSVVHRSALAERDRQTRLAAVREAFVKARR